MLRNLIFGAVLALAAGGTVQAQYPTGETCGITPTQFAQWYASGKVTNNGLVTFADSVQFPTQNTKCDFYKWGHQMFLWLTSPVSVGIVLDSPVIYDVDINSGNYIPNGMGAPGNSMAVRSMQVPTPIQPGGQAGGGDTLLTLNGSLVYFGIHANDVYAWFNTAVKNNAAGFSSSSPFPTSQGELTNVLNYASMNGANLVDGNALTMELKTAWVDGAKVANLADYVTIQAAVPNYVSSTGGPAKVGDAKWTIGTPASVTKTLALVGMHVVGSVQGHRELVWATFEHKNNAPDNSYYREARSPFQPIIYQVPYNSTGTWTFMASGGSQTGALVPQMTVDGSGNVVANATPPGINPNNVYRVNPWGNAPTAAAANNNTQLITLNGDIQMMLTMAGNDVRRNYIQVGSVWTTDGSIPSSPTDTGKQTGSLLLANTTMETYHQMTGADIKPAFQHGCFGCHNGSSSTAVSHIFPLNPLPTK
jgi:hypothetical protein